VAVVAIAVVRFRFASCLPRMAVAISAVAIAVVVAVVVIVIVVGVVAASAFESGECFVLITRAVDCVGASEQRLRQSLGGGVKRTVVVEKNELPVSKCV
jgi:hypothetical protein